MQIPQPSKMALIAKDRSQFISLNLDINQIGSKGCQFLSQSHWPNLKILDLSSNNITSEGIKKLCKSN
jgi:hypothetical protein